MPRLDAERLNLWRSLLTSSDRLERAVDAQLQLESGISIEWFEVLGALQRAGGPMRVKDLVREIAAVHSSLVRRIDRMVEEGLVDRQRDTDIIDARSVWLSLTREGRDTWRDANVVYRRAVQTHFATHLTDTDIAALSRILGKVGFPDTDS